ncbi:hypothetical protein ACLB2K_039665 [Fragaria x ananassa]
MGLVSRGVRYTRVGCPVEFSVRYCSEKGMYRVRHFVHKHSHELAQPNEVHFLRSNRNVEDRDVAQVQWLCGRQVHTSRAFEKLLEQAGGRDVVGFTVKDLYNKVDKLRKKSYTDEDAQAAMTWMNMRGIDSELFCCRYSLDEEGRLANLFWRDHQSLLDYKAYSDVLIMDTTYKTNLYRKPLVVFFGCNNHRATVVFGFALIHDGDETVRNVVERLMPAARHRLCPWHIGRNIGQNVKDHAAHKSLGKMIYISMSVTEWEAEWHSLVAKHGLVDNVWVKDLFNRRERWAEAFFRDHFYGGMCSTQRVEGMHSKLKPDLDRYTMISKMMPRMERSVSRIRDRISLCADTRKVWKRNVGKSLWAIQRWHRVLRFHLTTRRHRWPDNEELFKLPEDVAALQNSEEEDSHDDDAGEKLAEMAVPCSRTVERDGRSAKFVRIEIVALQAQEGESEDECSGTRVAGKGSTDCRGYQWVDEMQQGETSDTPMRSTYTPFSGRYNSEDQRVRLALEIVNDPRNEIFEQVCSVAAEEARDNTPATEVPVLCHGEDGSLATAGIKFNARLSRR